MWPRTHRIAPGWAKAHSGKKDRIGLHRTLPNIGFHIGFFDGTYSRVPCMWPDLRGSADKLPRSNRMPWKNNIDMKKRFLEVKTLNKIFPLPLKLWTALVVSLSQSFSSCW